MRVLRSTAAIAFLLVSACAAGRVQNSGNDTERITLVELNSINVSTAHQAVQRLRPQFLRDRNASAAVTNRTNEAITVYVDDARMGGIDALNQIAASEVVEIRRLSPGEATQKYGSRQMGTVIAVTRKRGGQ